MGVTNLGKIIGDIILIVILIFFVLKIMDGVHDFIVTVKYRQRNNSKFK